MGTWATDQKTPRLRSAGPPAMPSLAQGPPLRSQGRANDKMAELLGTHIIFSRARPMDHVNENGSMIIGSSLLIEFIEEYLFSMV